MGKNVVRIQAKVRAKDTGRSQSKVIPEYSHDERQCEEIRDYFLLSITLKENGQVLIDRVAESTSLKLRG